jgi:hypothetical protein
VERDNRLVLNSYGIRFEIGGAYGGNMVTGSHTSDIQTTGGPPISTGVNVCDGEPGDLCPS